MRIAVFGGSFDPVHSEHVQLVKTALEELQLDKLLVMPAYAPPHKKGKVLSPDEDRLAMCRLAFAGMDRVEVSDYEIRRGGTSYTYLTCEELKREYAGSEMFWLVGTDMLRDFPTWKYPEKILSLVTLAVCGRAEKGEWVEDEQEKFFALFGKKFVYLSYNGEDISSTKLRVSLGAGMRSTEFLPDKVYEYIEKKGLYEIPFAKQALALEKPTRAAHSLRVAYLAAAGAVKYRLDERQALAAALFHDCGKNVNENSPYLEGFTPPKEWGEIPPPVLHQFTGAYIAEKNFKVEDREILDAVRYHTSARPNMSDLEKLIFLADMLEEERDYEGVETLRALFWQDLEACMERALLETLRFLEKKGGEIYPLTLEAYEFYKRR